MKKVVWMPSDFLWPCLIQVLGTLALCFTPLFNVLSYEFCFAMGCLTALTAPFIALNVAQRADSPGEAIWTAQQLSWLHILPSLTLICFNAVRVQNCNFSTGLGFWFLMPFASACYGAMLGTFAGRVGLKMSDAIRRILLILLLGLPLLLSLRQLYTTAPIFVFDHVWGYFAGSLYDEAVHIDNRLLCFRLGTLIRIVAIGGSIWAWERWPRLGTPSVVSILTLAMLLPYLFEHTLGEKLGFHFSNQTLAAYFPITVERPGLVIHLPKNTSTRLQQEIADDHAFRLQQISQRLELEHQPVIHSFVYASAEDKAFYMGGAHTMVAKPWLRQIHIHGLHVPHMVMPHELTHALAASFGSAWLKVSARHELWVNMGLVEGLAQALSPDDAIMDLHEWARAMQKIQLAPDMRDLLGPKGFWSQAPQRAYTVAGSFVRYLLETYGAANFKLAYAHGDFKTAYGRSLDVLVSEWEKKLHNIVLSPRAEHIAQDRFYTPSIFHRICAHEIAALSEQAEQQSGVQAVATRELILHHLGKTPETVSALAFAQLQAGNLDEFLTQTDNLIAEHRLNALQQARIDLAASTPLFEAGRIDATIERLKEVLNLQVDFARERLAWVRLWALQQPQAVQTTLMRLLNGGLPDVESAVFLDNQLQAQPHESTYAYLLGRQLATVSAYRLALHYLEQSIPHPFVWIEVERQRLLTLCYAKTGQWARARELLRTQIQNAPTSGLRSIAQDDLARIVWQQNNNAATSFSTQPEQTSKL